jgi:microcystin degradation protein MlrC
VAPPRIAVGGFLHETNSFAPEPTPLSRFAAPGGWPPMSAGEALLPTLAGTSVPIAGAIAALSSAGATIVPTLWAMAMPAGPVTDDAFAAIADGILARLAEAGAVDGVYLDLHGAAVTDSLEDPEGALLGRVRAALGDSVPLVASLDMHANVTHAMVDAADLLDGFRAYPHTDLVETGARAARRLLAMVGGMRPAKAFAKPDLLIPLVFQSTDAEPMRGLVARMAEIERRHGAAMTITTGFPHADIAECGPALLAYAPTQAAADAALGEIAAAFEAARPVFGGRLWSAAEAVAHAMALPGTGPVILADTQDNPGGGGACDTTGLLRELVAQGATDAVVALIADPAAAAAAHRAGLGGEIDMPLGGVSDGVPFHGHFRVVALGDGRFVGTGPLTGGNHIDLGPMALLQVGGVRVIVASRKIQAHEPAVLRHVGIEPAEPRILVLKSSVHFRAAFAPLAREVLITLSPGPVATRLEDLPYRRLRAGLRPQARPC